jgi:uncharacterized protein YydD (DUF2326 family)
VPGSASPDVVLSRSLIGFLLPFSLSPLVPCGLSPDRRREVSAAAHQAIVAFEETSRALYEEAGNLTIEESLNGPKFEVTIQGLKSKGISNMQIFCFDMMLMRLSSERGMSPGFCYTTATFLMASSSARSPQPYV